MPLPSKSCGATAGARYLLWGAFGWGPRRNGRVSGRPRAGTCSGRPAAPRGRSRASACSRSSAGTDARSRSRSSAGTGSSASTLRGGSQRATRLRRTYAEPPPPPAPPEKDSSIPPFSVRVDPLNWILEGQLGFELEVGVLKWMTLEAVPMFVVDQSPPLLNLGGGDSRIYQHSNGLGPLAGATLGVNFWPSRAFKGYVIRTGLLNYGLTYDTKGDTGPVDSFSHTKREFYVMLGSVERWGAFTLAGGFGLGYELNKESRCIADTFPFAASSGNCDELQIKVPVSGSNAPGVVAVSPFTYPWEILARFSLGVTID